MLPEDVAGGAMQLPLGSQKPLAGTRQRLRCTPLHGHVPSLSERALLNGWSGFSLLPKGIRPQSAQDHFGGPSLAGRSDPDP
jgi:hypothetical protein